MRRTLTALACGLSLLGLPLHAPLQAEERPDFSGSWLLNEELSEDPREKMRQQRRGGRGAGGRGGFGGGRGGIGGGGRGGFGGGGIGGGGGRSRGPGGDPGAMGSGSAMGERTAPKRLEIEHRDPDLRITSAGGEPRDLVVDGEERESAGPNGEAVFVTASWKRGNRLAVERRHDGGRTVTQVYELVADGQRILVTVKVEGGRRGGVEFQRVYDVAEPEDPTSPTSSS